MTQLITSLLGWIGAVTILVAYGLSENKVIEPGKFWHVILNILGSIAYGALGMIEGINGMVFLNAVWLLIACMSAFRTFRAKLLSHKLV